MATIKYKFVMAYLALIPFLGCASVQSQEKDYSKTQDTQISEQRDGLQTKTDVMTSEQKQTPQKDEDGQDNFLIKKGWEPKKGEIRHFQAPALPSSAPNEPQQEK